MPLRRGRSMSFQNTKNRPKFGQLVCSKCNERQWSISNNRYLELFSQCWSCDKVAWQNKQLSLEEFERREVESLK